jgi:hypothetical protein
MLLRVAISAGGASGVVRIAVSHHPAGFAPYRIENCSLETLHARQYKVRRGPFQVLDAALQTTAASWTLAARCVICVYLAGRVLRRAPTLLPPPSRGHPGGALPQRAAGRAAAVLLPGVRLGRAGAASPPRAGAARQPQAGHICTRPGKPPARMLLSQSSWLTQAHVIERSEEAWGGQHTWLRPPCCPLSACPGNACSAACSAAASLSRPGMHPDM